MINKETFSYLVSSPEDISSSELRELEALSKRYPFCQLTHALLAKGTHLHKQETQAKEQIRAAAAYALSRNALRKIINGSFVNQRVAATTFSSGGFSTGYLMPKVAEPIVVEETKEVISTEQETLASVENTPIVIEESPVVEEVEAVSPPTIEAVEANVNIEKIEEVPQELEVPQEIIVEAVAPVEEIDEIEQANRRIDEILGKFGLGDLKVPNEHSETIERVSTDNVIETTEVVASPEEVAVPAEVNATEQDVLESIGNTSTEGIVEATAEIEMFQPQEIVAPIIETTVNEDVVQEAVVEQVETTLEIQQEVVLEVEAPVIETIAPIDTVQEPTIVQAVAMPEAIAKPQKSSKIPSNKDIIDKFIVADPGRIKMTREPLTAEEQEIEDLAERSALKNAKSMNLITESFAKIMLMQGRKDKAIEIYEKLILKFPEKKAYFAEKIAGLL
jgi:hypothetical protein